MPRPPTLSRSTSTPPTRPRTTRPTSSSRATRRWRPTWRRWSTARASLGRASTRLRRIALDDACGASSTRRAALPRRRAPPPPSRRVADMCIPGYWLAGFRRVPAAPRGWPTRWAGARWGSRSRPRSAPRSPATGPVVSVSGDGGFLFACGELATLAQERIPLTAVIVDDGGYGMLRYDQDAGRARALRRRPAHARLRRAGRVLRRARRDRRRPRRRVRRGARRPRCRPRAERTRRARRPGAAAHDVAALVPEADRLAF